MWNKPSIVVARMSEKNVVKNTFFLLRSNIIETAIPGMREWYIHMKLGTNGMEVSKLVKKLNSCVVMTDWIEK